MPSPYPTFEVITCSHSTCEELGWTDDPSSTGFGPDDYHFGTLEVCARSNVGNPTGLLHGCSGLVNHTAGRLMCESVGARLVAFWETIDISLPWPQTIAMWEVDDLAHYAKIGHAQYTDPVGTNPRLATVRWPGWLPSLASA